MPTNVETVLAVAAQEVGVHEQGGNNRGERVEEYLRTVGLAPGNPWCAAFVSWCLHAAGVRGGPCSGDTWTVEAWGRNHGCLYNADPNQPAAPKRGDIFLLLGTDNRPRHTGLVVNVVEDTVSTIEGNTGMASDTDGDGVARKTRNIRDCSFVRWADAVAPSVRTVKIFAHSGGRALVLDGVTYPLTDLVVNGADCSSLELIGKY